MSRHRDIIDAIENPPAMRPEKEIQKFSSLLDQIAFEDAEKARKQSLKLLRKIHGERGLPTFLNSQHPEHEGLTGEQMLVRDPHGLLEHLDSLLDEIATGDTGKTK